MARRSRGKGKPSFSLAVPSAGSVKYKHTKSFKPIIPKRLSSPAGTPLAGEGQWRVLETVKGQPAMFGTFLRPSSVYTSYVAGIVSMDQRLVSFQLRPGAEDPGPGNWKAKPWIPPGTRTGLIGTFNGGFKINTSGGGFYLNGDTAGTLTKGTALMNHLFDQYGPHRGPLPNRIKGAMIGLERLSKILTRRKAAGIS